MTHLTNVSAEFAKILPTLEELTRILKSTKFESRSLIGCQQLG